MNEQGYKAAVEVVYINCAGVNVPTSWTPGQLKRALEGRKMRFDDEEKITAAFDSFRRRRSR